MEKTYKAVIFTGYKCNNNCVFCMEADKRDLPVRSTVEIKDEIIAAKMRGVDYLELIGGEMTIRPDFIELIKLASELEFSTVMIATNGRMFSYKEIAEAALRAGLNSIVFSIHGPDDEIHDSLTRVPGSFNQLVRGVENVKEISKKLGLKVSLGTNTCIVKQNYKRLPEIANLIRSFDISNSEFIFVDCNEGGAFSDFNNLVPKISEVAPYARKCLDIGKKANAHHWHIRYVPLCHFRDHLNQISELQEVEKFKTEHIAQDFQNYDVEGSRKIVGRVRPKKCKNCNLYEKCEGIWKKYIEEYGDKELKPIK
jgi:MoaA/NifB/PqqE/SkfB family radical SAM enzyme